MIKTSSLTEKDMEVFEGKKVILYGMKIAPVKIYKIFKKKNIDVIACYCNAGKVFWECKLRGYPMVNRKQLSDIIKQCNERNEMLVIQPLDDYNDVCEIANRMKVACSPVFPARIVFSLEHLLYSDEYKGWFRLKIKEARRTIRECRRDNQSFQQFRKKKPENAIFICMPPKTADTTLCCTFEQTKQIPYLKLHHKPRLIYKKKHEKQLGALKMTLGVREPISQNLSMLYQSFSNGMIRNEWILDDLKNQNRTKRENIISGYESLHIQAMSNMQLVWDEYIKRDVYAKRMVSDGASYVFAIQNFIPQFAKYVLDITAYPFDKEKGYAIIKDGHTEVFVYQLEKLNSLVPELSAWVGVPFDKLEIRNQASDKWVAVSYKQAQDELEITQEYFDKCFDEPYVKHCYSQEDIEKFKLKWRSHIQ